jgi:serine/threonine-protein kinase
VLTVDVPLLEAAPRPPALLASAPHAETSPQPLTAAPIAALTQAHLERPGWQQPVGLSIGAAGLTGVAVGSYFGLRAIAKNADLEKVCPARDCGESPRGRELSSDAHSAARVANVLVIGGAVLLVSGALIFFSAPSGEAAELRVQAAAGSGGIELRGRM